MHHFLSHDYFIIFYDFLYSKKNFKILSDSGSAFEKLFLGDITQYHYYIGKFLIDKNNYLCDIDTFQKNLVIESKKNDKFVENDNCPCAKISFSHTRIKCGTLLRDPLIY